MLSLVRIRDGRERERLDLGPVFASADDISDAPQRRRGEAYLQRTAPKTSDADAIFGQDPRVLAEIARRPPRTVILAADYDHDGKASEFLIQVGTMPCGKHLFAAIGVTRDNPRLHALTSVHRPDKPLVLHKQVWDALLRSAAPEPVLIWECNDHGSEVRSLVEVVARAGRINAVDRDYECRRDGSVGPVRMTRQW